ncbi:MAG: outer membrane protein assembly factor BamD [Bacteroidetes bacterium]|nr:outer membrane protein assembly factor BamD [Bacteroidota bacterium]MBX7129577.1 outer membrane protein assembly factor BamD [Flavobacteriales bacterium]MCC6655895.1 outer membrane protein assembly factor BamD [Flavobacteriales bacterium]HMU14840.1 outer membrane protein assembly factor BamD [Flavobacteriales bacterium]HMZ48608.1 outer membrane protein assembly factor BamD [Flavobacteriales bacterium]
MRRLLPLALFVALLSASCGEYNRALKATGPDAVQVKLTTATKYYGIGAAGLEPTATKKQKRKASAAFEKALPLLEELTALTRGDTLFERVSYMYAKSYYGIKDYVLGGYYLGNFSKTFPQSKYAEECDFLNAMCSYRESPAFELDQTPTSNAIEQFQYFLVQYPNTTLTDSCNALIDQLRHKLEQKDHASAMQYVRTRNYEAAGVALRNFVKKWPNSGVREDALFNILKNDHDLAVNSVEAKKAQRVAEGLRSFDTFADAFPESARIKEAEHLRDALNRLSTKPNTPAEPSPRP